MNWYKKSQSSLPIILEADPYSGRLSVRIKDKEYYYRDVSQQDIESLLRLIDNCRRSKRNRRNNMGRAFNIIKSLEDKRI